MSRTAIVAGGGIAGLAAAIALRRAGFAVTAFEDAAMLAPIGGAISLWGNAMAALDRLGAGRAIRDQAQPIDSMAVYDRRGQAILAPLATPTATSFLPTRTLVQRTLMGPLGDVDLRLGRRVAAMTQDGGGVSATLADGAVHRADIGVVADGIWSATATALIGNAPRYGGVLGLSDPIALAGAEGAAREYRGDGERFGLFDIGGERRYWFWMRDEAPDDVARPIAIGDAVAAARGWPGDIAATAAATRAEALIRFSIHARPPPRRLGAGRIVCVGDAAHAMEPNLGQGACQGIEDAVVLGALARDTAPDDLAAAFTKARLRRVRNIVTSSYRGGRAVHARTAIERTVVRTAMRIAPRWVTTLAVARYHRLPR